MSAAQNPEFSSLVPARRLSAARPTTAWESFDGKIERFTGIPVMAPVVQAAAVAAGGFVAGAAVVRLAHRRRARSLTRAGRGRRGHMLLRRRRARGDAARTASVLEIVGSRSLLVDVHLLAGRD